LSNPDYAEEFNYINAVVKDRSNYIKDIHDDKSSQSDMVVLLLELSAIPDEVI